MLDLVFRDAMLPGAERPMDIGSAGGRIHAIAPRITCDAPVVELGGRAVVAGFVDTHVHLDKACLLGRCSHVKGGLKEAIAAVSALKREFTVEDVRGARRAGA